MEQSQSGPLDVVEAAPLRELKIHALPSPPQEIAFAPDRHLMKDPVHPNRIRPLEPTSLLRANPSPSSKPSEVGEMKVLVFRNEFAKQRPYFARLSQMLPRMITPRQRAYRKPSGFQEIGDRDPIRRRQYLVFGQDGRADRDRWEVFQPTQYSL